MVWDYASKPKAVVLVTFFRGPDQSFRDAKKIGAVMRSLSAHSYAVCRLVAGILFPHLLHCVLKMSSSSTGSWKNATTTNYNALASAM